jgi:DNA end-binding protein Ku
MSARSIGSAYVSFGLVTIPVKLYSAAQASESISFRMLHKKDGTPLRQQYICPKDGEVVERDDIVKGYEYAKDQYVLFSAEELKAIEEEATRTVAITEFVPQDKVDTIYFDKPYYLGPDKGGERAYRLLSEAMRKSGLVALANYAARGKGYLVLVRPIENGLVMQQLHYSWEVRPFSEVPVPDKVEVKPAELQLALQLIQQSVSDEFHPENYQDVVRARLQEIIPKAQVIDLMEALKASLGQAPAKGKVAATASAAERKPAKASPRKSAKKAAADEARIVEPRARKKSSR